MVTTVHAPTGTSVNAMPRVFEVLEQLGVDLPQLCNCSRSLRPIAGRYGGDQAGFIPGLGRETVADDGRLSSRRHVLADAPAKCRAGKLHLCNQVQIPTTKRMSCREPRKMCDGLPLKIRDLSSRNSSTCIGNRLDDRLHSA